MEVFKRTSLVLAEQENHTKCFGGDVPAGIFVLFSFSHLALEEKKQSVLAKFKKFQEDCAPITALFEKPEVVAQIKSARDGAQLLEFLKDNYNVKL